MVNVLNDDSYRNGSTIYLEVGISSNLHDNAKVSWFEPVVA